MRTRTFALWAIGVCFVSGSSAQSRADFSGTWIATKEPPPSLPAAPSPTFGERFAFRHSGDNLVVVRPSRETATAASFVIDGPETRTRVPGPLCQGDAETIETAARDGSALVLSLIGSVPPGGGPVMKREIRRTFHLQAPDTLVVDTRMAVQGELKPAATVYKRSTEPLAEPDPGAQKKAAGAIKEVAWIAGTWTGVVKATTVEERWTPPSGGSMLAVARTMRDDVMSGFEFLCITERGGSLVYYAMPNGRSPATAFTLTALTPEAATFENPAHDFPKMIRYAKLADGSLETTISGAGGQRAQSFVLKRQP